MPDDSAVRARLGRKRQCPTGSFSIQTKTGATPPIHSSREATIVQALHLARRCQIQKIEGPKGERMDNERFEREHLRRPSGHIRPL